MRSPRIPLYHQLLDIAYRLSNDLQEVTIHVDKTDGMTYMHDATEVVDQQLQQSIAILETDLLNGLSARAFKLLARVISEMKMNNIFWLSGPTSSADRKAIFELKQKDILIKTDRTGVYLINPFKLRRGKPLATIMASIAELAKDNSIVKLRDLRPPKKVLLASGR
jgi:hypothetical protein